MIKAWKQVSRQEQACTVAGPSSQTRSKWARAWVYCQLAWVRVFRVYQYGTSARINLGPRTAARHGTHFKARASWPSEPVDTITGRAHLTTGWHCVVTATAPNESCQDEVVPISSPRRRAQNTNAKTCKRERGGSKRHRGPACAVMADATCKRDRSKCFDTSQRRCGPACVVLV